MASGLPTTVWKKIFNNSGYTGFTGFNAIATHKIALANSTYAGAFAIDTADGWTNTNEVSGTGWATGGILLSAAAAGSTSTNPTLTTSPATVIMYDMDNVSVASTTLTGAAGCNLYADAVTAGPADPIFCWVDFGSTYNTSSGTFGITWAGTGVFNVDMG